MKLQWICFCILWLAMTACQSPHCHLPDLKEPSELTQISFPSRQHKWQHLCEVVLKEHQEIEALLEQGHALVFGIIHHKTPSFLLPHLTRLEQRLPIVEVAVTELFLKNYDFSKQEFSQQAQEISHYWQKLTEAEYRNLRNAALVAEIQQQWYPYTHRCSLQQRKSFSSLADKIAKLPTVTILEKQKQQLILLGEAFHQLAIANEKIQIPTGFSQGGTP